MSDKLSAAVAQLVEQGKTAPPDALPQDVPESVVDYADEATAAIANALPQTAAGPGGGAGAKTGGDIVVRSATLDVVTPDGMVGQHVVLSLALDLPSNPNVYATFPLEEVVEKAPAEELAAMIGASMPELIERPFVWNTHFMHPQRGESKGRHRGLTPPKTKQRSPATGLEDYELESHQKTSSHGGEAFYKLVKTHPRRQPHVIIAQAQQEATAIIDPATAHALGRPDLAGAPLNSLPSVDPAPAAAPDPLAGLAAALKADPTLLSRAIALAAPSETIPEEAAAAASTEAENE